MTSDMGTNPWLTIWLHPRATMRRILDSDPLAKVWLLGALGGVSQGLRALDPDGYGVEHGLSLGTMVLISIVVGALLGLIALLLMPYIVGWTGRWLGGEGSTVDLRASLAWSQVPGIWALALNAILIIVFGERMLAGELADSLVAGTQATLFFAVTISIAIVAVWQVFTTVKTVAEAHRFSAWRALFTLILAGLVAILALLAIVFVVGIVATGLA